MIIALIIFLVLLSDWIIYRILLQKQQRETTQITAELIRLDIEDTGHFKIKGQDWRFYDYQLTSTYRSVPTL